MAKTKGQAVSSDPPKTRLSGKTKPVASKPKVSPSTTSTAASSQKSFVYKTPSDKGTSALKSPSAMVKPRKKDMEKKDKKAKKEDKTRRRRREERRRKVNHGMMKMALLRR